MVEQFTTFIKKQYPNTEFIDDRNTYDKLNGGDFKTDGKRTGSKGNLIIRRKLAAGITDNEHKYWCEFTFYPFQNTDQMPDPETARKKKLMGYDEKMRDDLSYPLRRVLIPIKGALGNNSWAGLVFPQSIYPEIIPFHNHFYDVVRSSA